MVTFLAACGVGLLGWAFGIEPRIRVIETRHLDLKELIGSKLDDIDRRLTRIERHMNGNLYKE